MDGLAFKYKEMNIMESSTDSESEISHRWSDTSTMGCMSSTPERATIPHRTLPLSHKPAGKHGCYSMFLDPYDGSSEESGESKIDVSSKGPRRHRQPGGGSRSRRSMLYHPVYVVKNCTGDKVTKEEHVLDIQMKCGSESELSCREFGDETSQDSGKYTQSMDLELHCQLKDSDLHASGSSTPGPAHPVEVGMLTHSSSERPPCPRHSRSVHKRKMDLPGWDELEQRKKQCLVNMDEEPEEVDSAAEVFETQS